MCRKKWCNGHGSWVMWVMGQLCDGSHGSWVTKDDPFPSLLLITLSVTHFTSVSSQLPTPDCQVPCCLFWATAIGLQMRNENWATFGLLFASVSAPWLQVGDVRAPRSEEELCIEFLWITQHIMTTNHQRHRQTDRQTEGRTINDSYTTLYTTW